MQRHPHGPDLFARSRLVDAWRRREMELAALLTCREAELEHALREVRVHRLFGELPAADTLEQLEQVNADCEGLTAELVHVRCALLGLQGDATRPQRPAGAILASVAAA